MNKQGKVWGTTTLLYSDRIVSVHLLDVAAGGYCSEHRHAHKANTFYVISGALDIHIWPPGREVPDVTRLSEGQSVDIPAQAFHKFSAAARTLAVEICEQVAPGEDIERRVGGGVNQ